MTPKFLTWNATRSSAPHTAREDDSASRAASGSPDVVASTSRHLPLGLSSRLPGAFKGAQRSLRLAGPLDLDAARRKVDDPASSSQSRWQVLDGLQTFLWDHQVRGLPPLEIFDQHRDRYGSLTAEDLGKALQLIEKLGEKKIKSRLEVDLKSPLKKASEVAPAIAQELFQSISKDLPGLNMQWVRQWEQWGEAHGVMTPKMKAEFEALRHDPKIPVASGAQNGLLNLPREVIAMVGEHLLTPVDDTAGTWGRDLKIDHPDLMAFAATSKGLYLALPEQLSRARKDGLFHRSLSNINSLEDFDHCLSLIRETLSGRARSTGYTTKWDTERAACDRDSDKSEALKNLIKKITRVPDAHREEAFDRTCLLLNELPREQHLGALRCMLIFSDVRGISAQLKSKMVDYVEAKRPGWTPAERATLLPFMSGSHSDIDQLVVTTWRELLDQCERGKNTKTPDFAAALWALIDLTWRVTPAKLPEVAQKCPKFITQLKDTQKPAFLAAFGRLAGGMERSEQTTEAGRFCLQTGQSLSSELIDSDFAVEMAILYKDAPGLMKLDDYRAMLTILGKAIDKNQLFPLTSYRQWWSLFPRLEDKDDLAPAQTCLRATLSRWPPGIAAEHLEALISSTGKLKFEQLFIEQHNANVAFICSLLPQATGQNHEQRLGDRPADETRWYLQLDDPTYLALGAIEVALKRMESTIQIHTPVQEHEVPWADQRPQLVADLDDAFARLDQARELRLKASQNVDEREKTRARKNEMKWRDLNEERVKLAARPGRSGLNLAGR